ncbi:MAG: acetolactate synthase 2 small subunit [Psittacicella sp.]
MHNNILIEACDRPEILERIFRVIRHRGFKINKIESEFKQNKYEIKLVISSERLVSNLITQLEKLYDVTKVTLID